VVPVDRPQRYPAGLQDETEKEVGFKQYKLRGMPWLSYDLVQYVNGRSLLCDLLSVLEGVGYELVGSVNMTVGNDSRDGAYSRRLLIVQLTMQGTPCSSVADCEEHRLMVFALWTYIHV
jgi:hypothetical protein